MIPESHAKNYQTLLVAAGDGNLALVKGKEKATGKAAMLLCAVHLDDEDYVFTPLARMFDGNPYETYDPPTDPAAEEDLP